MDCPGHDILMATMLNGAAVMDAALLLIGNDCSQVLCLFDFNIILTISSINFKNSRNFFNKKL